MFIKMFSVIVPLFIFVVHKFSLSCGLETRPDFVEVAWSSLGCVAVVSLGVTVSGTVCVVSQALLFVLGLGLSCERVRR